MRESMERKASVAKVLEERRAEKARYAAYLKAQFKQQRAQARKRRESSKPEDCACCRGCAYTWRC